MLTFMILVVGGIGVVSLALWQKERTHKGARADRDEERAAEERTVRNLRVGDVVQHLGRDYLVEGKLTYNDEGFVWHEYMLVDRDDTRWLSVEQDDRLIIALYREVEDLPVSGTPPETVTYQGVTYRLDERGGATMTRQGDAPARSVERCRYYDYRGPGGKLLSIEQWGESFEVTVGEEIRESSLELLPGS